MGCPDSLKEMEMNDESTIQYQFMLIGLVNMMNLDYRNIIGYMFVTSLAFINVGSKV